MGEKLSFIIVAVTAAALAIAMLYASQEMLQDVNDAVAIKQAKISLTQAVSYAERHAHGKAARVELNDEHGEPVYRVRIINAGKTTDVHVDGKTGRILSMQGDQTDDPLAGS